MLAQFLARIGFRQENAILGSFLNPLAKKIPKLPQTRTLIFQMVAHSDSTKRPTCPSCSKPTRICLCKRLKNPSLHNSVHVTILQHSLEKKHPLNSTRIAMIGLKNVELVTVSDVNFQARFVISSPGSSCEPGLVKLESSNQVFDEISGIGECDALMEMRTKDNMKQGPDPVDVLRRRNDIQGAKLPEISKSELLVSGNFGVLMSSSCLEYNESIGSRIHEVAIASESAEMCFDRKDVALGRSRTTDFSFAIEKTGTIISFLNHSDQTTTSNWKKMSLGELFASDIHGFIQQGFVVKKLQRKRLEDSSEYDEDLEFELAVPAGSVLLFPSERSIDVEAVDFEVKNLIVLDGTWAKAKRMYNENPWLNLLPHVRLELDKLSLYREVRHQPEAGYLSTIESIVYALKAVGESSTELDGLLNVFESMVGDQRRCKDERLKGLIC